jgi:hypothetical protein
MAISNINEHVVESQQTVKEWLSQFELSTGFTSNSFLDLELVKSFFVAGINQSVKGVTNRDRITAKYTAEEYRKYLTQPAAIGDNVVIKEGTVVGLPNDVVRRQIVKSKSLPETTQLTEWKPFMAAQLKNLFEDPNYISTVYDTNGQKQVRTQINDFSVFVWIRSITGPGNNSQEGTWYNISAFVENLTTSVRRDVGAFSFSLTPIKAVYDRQVGWSMLDVKNYQFGSSREDVLQQATISKYRNVDDNFLARNDFFFNRVLQENDLVYIRFEGLKSEKRGELPEHAFGGQDVPDNIYDIIGLIDRVSEGSDERNVRTNVVGRDLMKLLIEDGSYFFPEQFGQNIFTNDDSKLTKRNRIELEARALTASGYSFKFVPPILKYIFNKFSNIGLVPSNVFDGYGVRAVRKKYRIETNNSVVDELESKILDREEREGIWRICEFIFDKSAASRVLADNSIATDNGSIINSIRKICQEPFIEFMGDTYGDKYYFVQCANVHMMQLGYRGLVYNDVSVESIEDSVKH